MRASLQAHIKFGMLRVAFVYIDGVRFKHNMAPGQLSEALATIAASKVAARLLRAPRLFVIGDEDDLAGVG